MERGHFGRPLLKGEFLQALLWIKLHPCLLYTSGKTLAILSLAVSPDFRCKGLAAALLNSCLETARQRGLERVVLTCKDHLIHYYQRFGFMEHGISRSVHGGAVWHDMECRLL